VNRSWDAAADENQFFSTKEGAEQVRLPASKVAAGAGSGADGGESQRLNRHSATKREPVLVGDATCAGESEWYQLQPRAFLYLAMSC
jgi:hypothetical protein